MDTSPGPDCFSSDIEIKEEIIEEDPMEGSSTMFSTCKGGKNVDFDGFCEEIIVTPSILMDDEVIESSDEGDEDTEEEESNLIPRWEQVEIKEEIKDEDCTQECIEIKEEIKDEDCTQECIEIKTEDMDIKTDITCKTDLAENVKIRKYPQKKWFCIYCEKFVICFPRHVLVHSNEPDVIDLINTPKGDEKNKKIRILKGRGALYVNSSNLYKNYLLVGKTPTSGHPVHYEPCPECGIFYGASLASHYKSCAKSDHINLSVNFQKSSNYPLEPSEYLKYVIFPELENNKITETIMNDPLIISFGNHLSEGKFRRQIKRKLQLIAIVLLKIKELEPKVNYINDVYNLDHWEKLVEAMKFTADTDRKHVGSVSRLLMNIARLEESRHKMEGDTEASNKFSGWLNVYRSSKIECESETPLLKKSVSLVQEKSSNETSRRKQQSSVCIYCNKLKHNFTRHLYTQHSSEKEVKEILELPKNSIKRVRKLNRLKGKGSLCYVCLYCNKITYRFPRHLYTRHFSEKEVKEVLALPKNSFERLRKLSRLRRIRTFQPNISCLLSNQPLGKHGSIRTNIKRHLLCPYCKKFLRASNMSRHIKCCFSLGVNYVRKTLKHRNFTLLSRKILYNSKRYDVEPVQFLKDEIYPNLKPDSITDLISTDPLLIAFGNALCKKKDKVNYIKIRLRKVAAVLDKMKKLTSEVQSLQDIFNPNLYDKFTEIIKLISRVKEYNSEFVIRLTGALLKLIAKRESLRCHKEGEKEKSDLISAWINKLVADPLFKIRETRNKSSQNPTAITESISHSIISLNQTNSDYKSSTLLSDKTKIRNKWKDEEKEVLKDMISAAVKINKLPSHTGIRKLKEEFPILQNRTVSQIYAYINNVYKVQSRAPKNDHKSDTGNSSMGEESDSIGPCQARKALHRKVPWDPNEKEAVKILVSSAIEGKKLPPISEIRQLKDVNPALKNRTVKQVYAYINNVYRKHLENPQTNEENQYKNKERNAENLQIVNSFTANLSIHKSFHNKTYWTYDEKQALHTTISNCLKNNKLPSKSELIKVKEGNPVLNDRTVTQIYAYVNNIYRKYLNRRTNEDYMSSDSDLDTKTEDLILRTHTIKMQWSQEERQVLEETISRSIKEKKLPHMSEMKALKEQHSAILENRSVQQMYAYVNNNFRKYHLNPLAN